MIRKQTLSLTFISFLFAITLITCKKPEPEVTLSLIVNPAIKSIDGNQGSFDIVVSATTKWTASSDNNWLTIAQMQGNADALVKVQYQANTSVTARTASITFIGTGVPNQTVTVTQAGLAPTLTVSPSNQNANATSGSAIYTVTSTVNWAVQSDQQWATITNTSGAGNGTITVNYLANTQSTQRTANISVSGSGVSTQIVSLLQAGAVITTQPTVTTTAISNIAQTTAITGGNVTADGGAAVTGRGVCYSTTNQTPTTADSKTTDGSGTGTFTSNLSGLTANTTYYVRAYATNANGTSYGTMLSFTTTAGSTLPTNGLVAYYPFNGNANDESGNNNNGTVNGATLTADRKGNANKAYSFDGVNDFITLVDNTFDFANHDYSISIWAKWSCNPNTGTHLFDKQGYPINGGNGYRLFTNSNGNLSYGVSGSPYKEFVTTNIPQTNQWYNILIVVSITGNTQIYLNGNLLFTDISSAIIGNNAILTIGKRVDYSSSLFCGSIDDIRIYNRALTETEIQALYNE